MVPTWKLTFTGFTELSVIRVFDGNAFVSDTEGSFEL